MIFVIIIFIFKSFFIKQILTQNIYDSKTGKIVLINVVWTEGIHSPSISCPTLPYNESNVFYPGYNELIPKGMIEHFVLGQKIRQRYAIDLNFTSKTFNSQEFNVQSIDLNPTKSSAISNFYGYFQPSAIEGVEYPDNPKWPKKYVPIPIHNIPFDFVFNIDDCPLQEELYESFLASKEYGDLISKYSSFFNELSTKCGLKIETDKDRLKLSEIFILYKKLNLQLSDNLITSSTSCEIFYNEFMMLRYGMRSSSDKTKNISLNIELAKSTGGPLLTQIITTMIQKQNNLINDTEFDWIKSYKYFAYSAKIDHLMGLFGTLNIDKPYVVNDTVITSATSLIFELWIDDNFNTNVKVLFLPWDADGLVDITPKINGCFPSCNLETFTERSKDFMWNDDYDTVCNNV